MDTSVGVPYVPIKSPIPPPSCQKLRNLENAYPPMYVGAPMRSVYERAGFDVNRGRKGRGKGPKSDDSSSTKSCRKDSTTSNSTSSTRYLNPSHGSSAATSAKTSPTPTLDSASSGFGAHKKVSLPHISVVTNSDFNAREYYSPAPHTTPNPPSSPQPFCRFPTPPHSSANCHFPEALHPPEVENPNEIVYEPPPRLSDTPTSPYTFDEDPYEAPPVEAYPRPLSSASSIYSNAVDPVVQPSPYPSGRPQQYPEPQAPERRQEHNMPNYRRKNSHASQPSSSSSASSRQDSLYSAKGLSTPISPAASDTTAPLFQSDSNNKPKRKKQCRGCGQTITGKCVSSKDGRLSGKWHRDCFVCASCNHGFDSTEFYVFNDLPYCRECYHYENNSICQTCCVGIEGECLETSNGDSSLLRYHLECLTCSHCQVSLTDVYYCAPDGRTLCSTHAYTSNAKLEKRRTRILVV